MAELLKRRDNYEKEQTKNMKKTTVSILIILLAAALSVSIFAIAKTNGEGEKIYPERPQVDVNSIPISSPLFDGKTSIAEAYGEADLVAVVKIEHWLGEIEDFYTIFEASVENILKNDIGFSSDTLNLAQFSTTQVMIDGYPPFPDGERMLLCLNLDHGYEPFEPYGEVFCIIGEPMTQLYVRNIDGFDYFCRSNTYDNLDDIALFAWPIESGVFGTETSRKTLSEVKLQIENKEMSLAEANEKLEELELNGDINIRFSVLSITLNKLLEYFSYAD